jgi:hypothetical protein
VRAQAVLDEADEHIGRHSGEVGCDGSHLFQSRSLACASKTRTPSRLMTSERCGLSQEKLSASGKKPSRAARKIEQAESGQATQTQTPIFIVDSACQCSTH